MERMGTGGVRNAGLRVVATLRAPMLLNGTGLVSEAPVRVSATSYMHAWHIGTCRWQMLHGGVRSLAPPRPAAHLELGLQLLHAPRRGRLLLLQQALQVLHAATRLHQAKPTPDQT